uniref:Polysaccharide pyruvyl transferase domain-containing protein n=1 Tax=viral metagenome TaxID=1070528 RepID=A0A6C0LCM5_9ZZZZ
MILLWMQGDPLTNIGDIITPYLYKKFKKEEPIHWTNYFKTNEDIILSTGSILNNISTNSNVIIWGSGIIKKKENLNSVKQVLAVRGPITRKVLLDNNIYCPEIYGDPALCLPKVYPKKKNYKYKLGIIPHFVDYDVIFNLYCDNNEINIISTRLDVEPFIDEVCKCKKIISTSLHGLIISHAYSIPGIAIKISDKLCGDGTKFIDYKLSVGLDEKNIKEIDINNKDINFLLNLVDQEVQPNFPINTDKLWDCCPFR